MSDRSAATITIGGKLTKLQARGLAEAIAAEGIGPEWNERLDDDDVVQESIADAVKAKTSLVLFADEVTGGHFPHLESICIKLGLSFARVGQAHYGYDAEVRYCTPDDDWSWVGDIHGTPHLSAADTKTGIDLGQIDTTLNAMQASASFALPLEIVAEIDNV